MAFDIAAPVDVGFRAAEAIAPGSQPSAGAVALPLSERDGLFSYWAPIEIGSQYDFEQQRQVHTSRSVASAYWRDLPGVWTIVEGLSAQGFAAAGTGKASIERTTTRMALAEERVAYKVWGVIRFERGIAVARYRLMGAGSTLAETAANAALVLEGLTSGQVIGGGKGMIDRARALACEVAEQMAAIALPTTVVEILCATRGGRGGRLAKTLRKAWTVDDLRNGPPERREPETATVTVEILKSWPRPRGGFLRRGKAEDGTVYQWRTSWICGGVGERVSISGVVRIPATPLHYLSSWCSSQPGPITLTHAREASATAGTEPESPPA